MGENPFVPFFRINVNFKIVLIQAQKVFFFLILHKVISFGD
jgi:hypothetical protein